MKTYNMVKYNYNYKTSTIKRKSDKCSFHDLNGSYHIGQGTNLAKEDMTYPEKTYMKGSMLHRPKVTSVGGESIMLILLLLPLSGNVLY